MLIIVLGLALVIGFAVGFAQETVNYLHKNGKVIRTWAAVVSIFMLITGFILCLCSQWLIGFAFFISAIILTVCTSYDPTAEQLRRKPYYGIHLSKQQIYNLNNDISLPCLIPDYIPVNLNRDEIAVFDADAAISETKSRVIGRNGSYGGGTMRIAKGLSIHTGSSSSLPIYGDVNTRFPGRLVITTQRVIFAGTQKGFEFPLNKIAVFNVSNGTLSIQSGRSVFAIILSAPYLAQTAFNGVYNNILPLEIECNNTSDYSSESDNYINQNNIDNMGGHKFEYFCADLLRKNGFSDVSVTPGSGDQGVDILAEKEGIKYAIQCKNYTSKLSNTPVQEVNAGKTFYRCHVGVVMTNSTFTPGAKELAKATGVLLWDKKVIEKMIGANTKKDCSYKTGVK